MSKPIIAACLLISLTACQAPPLDETKEEGWGIHLHTDTLTGCQYFYSAHKGGITPRLGADGNQICKEAE